MSFLLNPIQIWNLQLVQPEMQQHPHIWAPFVKALSTSARYEPMYINIGLLNTFFLRNASKGNEQKMTWYQRDLI